MHTIDIPRKNWAKTLQAFSLMHEGWLISLEVLGPDLGAQQELHDLPLAEVVSERSERGDTITISVARSASGQLTHTIHRPTGVRIERTDEGADLALQIETADGTTTILQFRTAALPETVDGIVRGRL